VMANIAALKKILPRFFGTLMRGMCFVGLIRSHELQESFCYSETTLKDAESNCDAEMTNCYTLILNIVRNKIDSRLKSSLDNFNWVMKVERDIPNDYCDEMISDLRDVFNVICPMDETSVIGLKYSVFAHLSQRMSQLLVGDVDNPSAYGGLSPISKIDAFGIQSLNIDILELQQFADSIGLPGLSDEFAAMECLTRAMLDKDLPLLLQPENMKNRRKRYQHLSMDKLVIILEKYQDHGAGFGVFGGQNAQATDTLTMDKKEVQQLLRLVRSQGVSF